MVLDRPARTLLTPRIRSPLPVLLNTRTTANEQQHHKMQQSHDAWDESWACNTISITSTSKINYNKFLDTTLHWLFGHAWEWYEQMHLVKTVQNPVKNFANGATDQRESMKHDMKLYVKDPTPHTQLAQIWCSQVAKRYINPTWMKWSKVEHPNNN